MNILLVGSFPPPIGGTTLTLELLHQALCESNRNQISVVNLFGIRGSGLRLPLRILRLVMDIIRQCYQANVVSLHIATTALPWAGALLIIMCKILNKPLIIRKFASTDYEKNLFFKLINNAIIRKSTLFLVETRDLLARSVERGHSHALWFPTHRDAMTGLNKTRVPRATRYIFLGQVRAYKGVNELIEAFALIKGELPDVHIDLYGPLYDSFCETTLNNDNVRYCGVVGQSQVANLLLQYDVLILPTKAQTEGYPGAIVEALSVGLPIISTTCGAIPELVSPECGLLVTPGDVKALTDAVRHLSTDETLYLQLRKGAETAAFSLDTKFWSSEFEKYCGIAIERHSSPPGKLPA